MSRQVEWNKIVLEEFIALGGLTKTEEQIMRTRVAGWSRVEQSMKLGLSIATIDRIIARCKQKYDNCQQYSPLLPPRKKSK
jgi:DNA-directed RNA polymerase specialized sigma24 family protein